MKSVLLIGDTKKGNHRMGPSWPFYSRTLSFGIKIMQINQEIYSSTGPKDENNYYLGFSTWRMAANWGQELLSLLSLSAQAIILEVASVQKLSLDPSKGGYLTLEQCLEILWSWFYLGRCIILLSHDQLWSTLLGKRWEWTETWEKLFNDLLFIRATKI